MHTLTSNNNNSNINKCVCVCRHLFACCYYSYAPWCCCVADNATQFRDNYNSACRCFISVHRVSVQACVCVCWYVCVTYDEATFMLRIRRLMRIKSGKIKTSDDIC